MIIYHSIIFHFSQPTVIKLQNHIERVRDILKRLVDVYKDRIINEGISPDIINIICQNFEDEFQRETDSNIAKTQMDLLRTRLTDISSGDVETFKRRIQMELQLETR